MNNLDPVVELVAMMGQAQAALTKGDMDAANVAMDAAAGLCRGLQAAGVSVPEAEMEGLRELTARCGLELARLGNELNAESFRDDNHRRGITIYNNVSPLR
jgi:hypothetical protein